MLINKTKLKFKDFTMKFKSLGLRKKINFKE